MKKRILIIEDEKDLVELYLDVLKGAGFAVEAAFDGQEGLEKLKGASFDLLLLDIMLPKVDGLEVLKAVRSDSKLAKVPVVLLTNLDKSPIVKEGFMLGADGYMVKTDYTPAQLVEEVKKFLERK